MKLLSKLISNIILLWEVQTYGTIFLSGIIIIIERSSIALGVGILLLCIFQLIACFLSDKIKEKAFEIQFALYDLPWFVLSARERKWLTTTMHLTNLNWEFNAGGFHPATLERFATIVQSAGKSCLVICDIAKKY